MKQIKFLKTVTLEGKPIWLAGCSYECCGESDTQYGHMYKLISEDMIPRGIYSVSEGKEFIVIEPKKEEKKEIIPKKVSKKSK